jgi:hypothetical protein
LPRTPIGIAYNRVVVLRVLQAAVVEVKCPTPYYPVNGKPWAFGVRGASGYRPYKCMKAHYYCQAQLNMLVTGAWQAVGSYCFDFVAYAAKSAAVLLHTMTVRHSSTCWSQVRVISMCTHM